MTLVDTHAHLYSEKFNDDLNDVIKRSQDAGVERIYMPNIDSKSIDSMLELEHLFPDYCIPTMGLHPCHVDKDFEKELYLVEDWLSKRSFVAVGEMGTDLYWDKTNFELQKKAFIIQCDLAVKYNIPIIIHCRESVAETIQLVAGFNNAKLKGIFHCFNGDVKQADEVIDLGFVVGIGGVSTFKNGGLDDLIIGTDLKSIVLETDSPYLAPVPYRGKRNEPSYVKEVAKKVADLKNLDLEQVGRITTENAYRVYSNV
ncbi:TatD family hydrolase [Reichenbachiella sp. MALMAid0571]|uniref:TatD family hydrolase n=1 Tax=Reichenbachiella sp. MALMAid0571 TaxID=3143939 RepID=UPI0032DE5EE2